MSLKKANEHRNAWFEGVQKCTLDESLFTVMERIVRAEVHRLVVTDENSKVIGIISLSDILLYLVLRPSGEGLGDCESLRASDPILKSRERLDSISQQLYNRSNESIEEETNELEDEDESALKTPSDEKESDGDKCETGDDDNAQTTEDKTEDNLDDNNKEENEPADDHLTEVHVIKPESDQEDSDEIDQQPHMAKDNGNLNLNIQREVAMVSE